MWSRLKKPATMEKEAVFPVPPPVFHHCELCEGNCRTPQSNQRIRKRDTLLLPLCVSLSLSLSLCVCVSICLSLTHFMFSHPVLEIQRGKSRGHHAQCIRFPCSATRWNTMDDSISHVCSSDAKKASKPTSEQGETGRDEHTLWSRSSFHGRWSAAHSAHLIFKTQLPSKEG